MTDLIDNLLKSIEILLDRNDPLIKVIKYPQLLQTGLAELRDLVEMTDIKKSIVNQIQFLITNEARKKHSISSDKSLFENHMLHSVISGQPGTGKTTVALILAKIWMALGFVKKYTKTKETKEDTTVIILDNPQKDKIKKLQDNELFYQRKLDKITEFTNRAQTLTGELRRKTIRCKNLQTPDDKDWAILINLNRELRFTLESVIRESTQNLATLDEENEITPKFTIATREDFIAEYLGQTGPKTKKVLEKARGGVLFIDEAYNICNSESGSKDKYGEECLTAINEFMSLFPDEIIIIFAGYKEKLMKTIFKIQPGLYRRCAWFFEIEQYTPKGLSEIFTRQLKKNSWMISDHLNVEKFLKDHQDLMNEGGGSTLQLAFQCKIAYARHKFEATITNHKEVEHDSVINELMLIEAINQLEQNNKIREDKSDRPPEGMYM